MSREKAIEYHYVYMLISVGGPKETMKLRVNIILVSCTLLVHSRDSVILGSTVGLAIVQNVPHVVNKSIIDTIDSLWLSNTLSVYTAK